MLNILRVRNRWVILDREMADHFGLQTRTINQTVSRNRHKFTDEYAFRLSDEETADVRAQIIDSNPKLVSRLRSPNVFTDKGVVLLSALIDSSQIEELFSVVLSAFAKASGSSPTPSILSLAQTKKIALEAEFPEVRDRANHLISVLQGEIAAHSITAIPNDPERYLWYREKTDFLAEMLAGLRSLVGALPSNDQLETDPVNDQRLLEQLFRLRDALDATIKSLDADTGTYGAVYKVGLIASIAGLLALFPAVTFAQGALVAAGPIGAQTIRLIIDARKDN